MIALASLAIFSGLSLNLLLSFALGTADVVADVLPKGEPKRQLPFFQFGVMFISVLFLWLIFANILPPIWRGFSEYFLFFPFSALVCMGLELLRERIFPRFFPKLGSSKKVFSAFTAYDGLVPASLIITFLLAGNFSSAVVLALFFVTGNVVAMLILYEIRRRSTLEWVPRYIRGTPLIIISMGLLSLVTLSVAVICLKILEVF
jgi:electron transport complex protein RnfA